MTSLLRTAPSLAAFRHRLLQFFSTHSLCPTHSKGLLAVSGGLDSTLLMTVYLDLQQELGWSSATVMTFDHGLRAASSREALWVAEVARGLGYPVEVVRLDLPSEGPSVQNKARVARRAALEAFADREGLDWIATGHHLDDQAETVLLRLLRGTSPEGIAGIRPKQERWVRPLLAFRKEELKEVAEQLGLRWQEDPSNANQEFRRNSLRHRWIPALEESFNPRWSEQLAALAEEQREDEEVWRELLRSTLSAPLVSREGEGVSLDLHRWQELPAAVQRRGLKQLVREVTGGMLQRVHLLSLLEVTRSCEGAVSSTYPAATGCLVVSREYARLRLTRTQDKDALVGVSSSWIDSEGVWQVQGGTLTISWAPGGTRSSSPGSLWSVFVPAAERRVPAVCVRVRKPGDRLVRKQGGTRSLKRWWISRKIPAPLRGTWPVVSTGGVVFWIPGLRFRAPVEAQPGESGWSFVFEPSEPLTKAMESLPSSLSLSNQKNEGGGRK